MTVPVPAPYGLFVGLSTLDIIQRVDQLPGSNAKATALRQDIAGGGPALNAAVVFSALGGRAVLLTRLGQGGIAQLIRADIESHGVEVADFADPAYIPSVSTITVHGASGDRQIVSTDAQFQTDSDAQTASELELLVEMRLRATVGVDIVHLDGHHPDLAMPTAHWSNRAGLPLVVDAGRWKPVMSGLMPLASDVICSADFVVPCEDQALLPWLLSKGVELAAVTNGAAPVRWATATRQGSVETEKTVVVDTVGAGDFFHGAYSFAHTVRDRRHRTRDPSACLRFAAHISALKCAEPGTRSWLDSLAGESLSSHLLIGEET